MKIGIIGGGITGLSAAYELAKTGHRLTVFERSERVGGLAGSFRVGDTWLEKYYHHIFKSDRAIIGLIDEVGLGGSLTWKTSPMGFFHKGKIYPFGSPLELIRFKPLSFMDRLKLGMAILRLQRMKDWEKLDRITCHEWFSENVSQACYEVVWEPLLRLKFGEACGDIPAAWIWGRIHPRARSRSSGGIREELGYLEGGFQLLHERLKKEIASRGGEVRLKSPVDCIMQKDNTVTGIVSGGREFYFDRVVSTLAAPAFLKIAPPLPAHYCSNLMGIQYQAVVCIVLECERSLSPIYWLNISDPAITFGGVIEHTNFISPEHYGGRRFMYIFNYVKEDHPFFRMSPEEYFALHEPSLRRINPAFNRSWVRDMHLFKSRYGTVVYTLGYREKMPAFETPVKGLSIANTSQIYPYDRNMNSCVAIGQKVAQLIV